MPCHSAGIWQAQHIYARYLDTLKEKKIKTEKNIKDGISLKPERVLRGFSYDRAKLSDLSLTRCFLLNRSHPCTVVILRHDCYRCVTFASRHLRPFRRLSFSPFYFVDCPTLIPSSFLPKTCDAQLVGAESKTGCQINSKSFPPIHARWCGFNIATKNEFEQFFLPTPLLLCKISPGLFPSGLRPKVWVRC